MLTSSWVSALVRCFAGFIKMVRMVAILPSARSFVSFNRFSCLTSSSLRKVRRRACNAAACSDCPFLSMTWSLSSRRSLLPSLLTTWYAVIFDGRLVDDLLNLFAWANWVRSKALLAEGGSYRTSQHHYYRTSSSESEEHGQGPSLISESERISLSSDTGPSDTASWGGVSAPGDLRLSTPTTLELASLLNIAFLFLASWY